MFRRCSLVFGTVVLLLGLGGPLPAAAAPAAKVEVCHLPPGNKANFHTITISPNALAAHLAHGDHEDACENLGEILCDDANVCTYDGFATGTTVCVYAPVNCSDSNPCTTDSCNLATGCEATPVYDPFPASGQTTAYTADKNDGIAGEVAVPDDGTVQAGATLSYTDNGDGTVTDNNTGLMWEKKTNLDSTRNFANLHDADNVYYWSSGSQETIWDWIDDMNAEGGTGYAGHNDWRIPNVKELQSIVDYSILYPGPVINPIFGPTVGHGWWSSTSYATAPSDAWDVYFWSGYVAYNGKSVSLWVRAVRGGS